MSGKNLFLIVVREPRLYLAIIADLIFLLLLSSSIGLIPVDATIVWALLAGTSLTIAEYLITRSLLTEARGWLSNIYGLLLVSVLVHVLSVLPVPVSWLAFTAGMSLGLNAVLWGDLFVQGHYDNWLWVLSSRQINRIRRALGSHLLKLITAYFAFITASYVAAFFALRSEIGAPISGFWQWPIDPSVLGQTGLILLVAFVIWLAANNVVAIRKYHLTSSKQGLKIRATSPSLLWKKLTGQGKGIPLNFLVKQIQREQFAWILLLAGFITFVETIVYLLAPAFEQRTFIFLFFMVPFASVLLFGIVGHSTSSELGGLYGVLLSALVTWIVSLLIPSYSWNRELLFLVLLSAIVAWAMGLFSSIFAKGVQKMSLLSFVIQLDFQNRAGFSPSFLDAVRKSLESGYEDGINILFGSGEELPVAKVITEPGLVVSGAANHATLSDKVCRFNISYRQRPFTQQLNYSLCSNRLGSSQHKVNEGERTLLPVLPVCYYHPGYLPETSLDATWNAEGDYSFLARKTHEPVNIPAFITKSEQDDDDLPRGYRKELSEFFDNMLTRSVEIQTDLFCAIYNSDKDGQAKCLIVGFCRGQTSTKSYVTLEAEVIARRVFESLRNDLGLGDASSGAVHCSRLYYPSVSIYDYDLTFEERGLRGTNETLPNDAPLEAFPLEAIREYLPKLPERAPLPTLTANVRRQVVIWVVQVSIVAAAALLQLNDRLSDMLANLIGMLFGTGS